MSETLLLLGEIKGKLDMVIDSQAEIKQELGGLTKRVGKTEIANAKYGVVAGTIAAVGVDLIKKQMGL